MNFAYYVFWCLFRVLFATYFRWRIHNPERVPMAGPVIMAANHTSFLDPPLVGAALKRPLNYLARDTLFPVPIVGWLLRRWKVVPVDRDGGGAAGLRAIFDRLLQGGAILLFPEGTSTNGEKMLPFQTVPLAAPLRNRSIIVPVTITYKTIDEQPVTAANRDFVYWYGDMEFVTHFWNLLGRRSVEVLVTIQPKIECFRYVDNSAGRKKLAKDCYNRVLGRFRGRDLVSDAAGESADEPPSTSLSS